MTIRCFRETFMFRVALFAEGLVALLGGTVSAECRTPAGNGNRSGTDLGQQVRSSLRQIASLVIRLQ